MWNLEAHTTDTALHALKNAWLSHSTPIAGYNIPICEVWDILAYNGTHWSLYCNDVSIFIAVTCTWQLESCSKQQMSWLKTAGLTGTYMTERLLYMLYEIALLTRRDFVQSVQTASYDKESGREQSWVAEVLSEALFECRTGLYWYITCICYKGVIASLLYMWFF